MSSVASRFGDLRGALASGCDRLIHPRIDNADMRAEQSRLIGALLCGPFAVALATWVLMPAGSGLALTLSFVCATFGLAWTGVLTIATTGSSSIVSRLALLISMLAIAALVAAGGGPSSPVAALVLALPAEAFLSSRRREALLWGATCAVGALCLQAVLPFTSVQPAAWQWLLPLGYASTVWLRMGSRAEREALAVETPKWPALEDAIEAFLVKFSPNGDVTDASEAAERMLGIEPGLLLGQGLFERIHVTDRIVHMSALADLRDGANRRSVELRLRASRAEGADVADVYDTYALELSKSAATSGIIGVFRSVGDKAELRRRLAEASEINERLDQAKGRFLATVSHELRTPLNSIIGFSDMLIHEMFGSFRDPRQKEYVEIIRESGNHLLAIVNSILDVSKIDAGTYTTNPEPFRLCEAIDNCRTMLSVQADAKNIKLTTSVAPEVGEVRADRRAIQQILINLVSNAVKFTPQGGSVSIGAKRLGSRVHLWVSDTGIGIAEDDLERLGQPFAQVQNAYNRQFEGTGLGLSLVKGLVTLHEGSMSIDSALGEGTTVTVTLPVDGPKDHGSGQGGDVVSLAGKRFREDGHGALRKAG